MKNSKKSVVQHAKVFNQLNGEQEIINNNLNVKIVFNYSRQIINLFQILTKKFGLKSGL